MDWIFEHFQIVILVVLGLGSLLKTMVERASNKREEQTWEDDVDEVPDHDEWRTTPQREPSVPPPIQRTATPPPIPSSTPAKSGNSRAQVAAREAAAALKHQQDLAERLKQIRATKATTSGGANATRARNASKNQPKVLKAGPLSLRDRLKNPEEVRQAIVLREVLGPPVGLR